MAEKKPAAPAPTGDKPKLPLVPIIGAALGSAALVAGLMFFMMPKPAPVEGDKAAEASESEPDAAAAGGPTLYVEMNESLVVNLAGGGPSFLQVEVQLATRGEEGKAAIEAHLPALRSALLILLRQTTAEELAQPDAMVVLQDRARAEANRVIEAETKKKDVVTALLFTSFVTQ